jgi:hypothetical protein
MTDMASIPPSLEDLVIMQIIDQAGTEQLLQLLERRLDELLSELASTPEGKARILKAVSQKATSCERYFPEYESMSMDMTTTVGDCERMKDIKTGIEFLWCPHWGAGNGYQLHVSKSNTDTADRDRFQKKGVESGFESTVDGFKVRPNPTHKNILLDLCKSEGMDPAALACLNLLLELKWFYKSNKRGRI